MTFRIVGIMSLAAVALLRAAAPRYDEIDQPPHSYWTRPLKDRFSLLKSAFESGQVPFDRSGEKAFLLSLLKRLGIPASSQMLVFSTTSLQLSLINPSNPRALYFNEDIYLGYIPGGKIEIVSLDPELGGIFYIFDIPRGEAPLRAERATRCMNCHAGDDTGRVPGIVIKSVIPGGRGGSLDAFRIEQTGHQIPLSERFGGWYLTGQGVFTNHWANVIGNTSAAGLEKIPLTPGVRFNWDRYPVATSDLLPHLIHEHQAGFANRVIQAGYRARTALFNGRGKLSAAAATELDGQARLVTRYLLFADEAPLPTNGVAGEAAFKADFARNRKPGPDGATLKDFDLATRLFKHRCSYMIYSPVFAGLPREMKDRIYRHLGDALNPTKPDGEYAYLSAAEKQAIRGILQVTLKDLPPGW